MNAYPPTITSDAWLAAIVEGTTDAIVSKTLDGIVTSWNASAQRIFGYTADEMIGQSILKLIPLDRRDEETLILSRIRRGERLEHFETKRRRKDGSPIDISLTVSPIMDDKGRIVGVSKIARDISEERRGRETQRLLMREVNHRSKNLLAVIEAMVRQTVDTSTPVDFSRAISGRIAALSLTQDLIVRADWQGVDLRELVMAHAGVIAAMAEGRYTVTGPEVRVSPSAAQALGLALHELFVGSAQRLSRSESGAVAISWTSDQDGQSLALGWAEELDDPGGVPTTNDDFARTILSKVAPMSLNGLATLNSSDLGWRWTLTTKSDSAFGPQIVDPLGFHAG
ncbi:PAS domain S-box protein [Devosia sp. ZB163]|uniref:PAS domain S-box protein n=1 Tax=Devosia sp. ZB163 TaxID=3025938 RepID=UPI00235DD1F4|nr:PAS domain S-box protein [Devosia sp. ZB163]MDC9824233.1 PAS domain S-box protein [Devosia sp. ZB163]